jgi:hypothetical protein
MRRTATLALVLVGVFIAVTVSVVGPSLSQHDAGADVAVAAADPGDSDDDAGDAGTATARRGGPPAWAHSVSRAGGMAGLGAWERLSPAERERLMTRLAAEHRNGMEAYHVCRAEGRTDCSKPLPPGLAKRR